MPLPLMSSLHERPEPAALVVHQGVTALKEVEQFKDEFISIIAHELRTPLAILKGFVQTLLDQTAHGKGSELAGWQTRSLQGIELATDQVIDLANDLLDATRAQAGRLELQREPTDLAALARRVLTRRQLTTEQHTLSLTTMLLHLVLSVDPRRIEQVLVNLLGKAITYRHAERTRAWGCRSLNRSCSRRSMSCVADSSTRCSNILFLFFSDAANANPPFLRSLFLRLPGKLLRALGHQLVAQRPGIVVVDQQKRFAQSERVQAAKDQGMPLARGNSTYIQSRC